MLRPYAIHNQFTKNLDSFLKLDPHLNALAKLKYQHSASWYKELDFKCPGIYILTGGRQIGKSTSCKLMIKNALKKKLFSKDAIFYLPCDEIFDALQLSKTIRFFLDNLKKEKFLLIIDEITFVKNWDRVIKAIADEGFFRRGLCVLTGSDTLILKEASISFPGRRGKAAKTDFHIYPLSFYEYVKLTNPKAKLNNEKLLKLFENYLRCGGYLRAINDLAENKKVSEATFLTYEQWLRGDFFKKNKSQDTLLQILKALLTIGVSHISYSSLTQKIGFISKDTCIEYCNLLERMDILIDLQAFDEAKKQGFPKKARKFHFVDPFIYLTIFNWLKKEALISLEEKDLILTMIEAIVAAHCKRLAKTYYYKGVGEVDVIYLRDKKTFALEVKWTNKIKDNDLKVLKHFKNRSILSKSLQEGTVDNILVIPVYKFLYDLKR